MVSMNKLKKWVKPKNLIDPLGIGHGDFIFGSDSKGPDISAEEQAQAASIAAEQAAYDEFVKNGYAQYGQGSALGFEDYGAGERLAYEDLDPESLSQLGPSAFDDISTDPRYRDVELAALSSLEERMNGSGLTLQDEADMARLNAQVNTQNRGRLGAIQENMASRGMSGSGMDLLSQLQASQNATEMQAYQSLEQAAQAQNQKRQSAIDAGNMGSRLRGQAFSEDAAKAQARDAIERFNTQNSVSAQVNNNQGRNQANQANWSRGNQVSDMNVGGRNQTSQANWDRANSTMDRNTAADNQFRQDKVSSQVARNRAGYDWAADQKNQKMMQDEQERQAKAGRFGAVLGAAGGAFGAMKGGPAGAQAGYQIGSGVGQSVGRYAHGGMIHGDSFEDDLLHGDSYENDNVPILASKGEVIIPRSIADDPVAASEFVAEENGQELDAVGHLLAAMQLMNRRK